MRPTVARRVGFARAGSSVPSTPALQIPPRRTRHALIGIRLLLVCVAGAGVLQV